MILKLKADFDEIEMTKIKDKMTLKTDKYAMKILFHVEPIKCHNLVNFLARKILFTPNLVRILSHIH